MQCAAGYRVAYHNTAKLFARLKMAKADGSYLKDISKLEKQHLLILEDFGLQPFDALSRAALMEIIEDRHGKSSTIITSQIPVGACHDVIGEPTVADAILDRLVYAAHRLELKVSHSESVLRSPPKNNPTNYLFFHQLADHVQALWQIIRLSLCSVFRGSVYPFCPLIA